MGNNTNPDTIIDDIRELLIDFGLPVIILLVAAVLLITGIDGEVKTILAAFLRGE